MEQKREPKNKPTDLWSVHFQQSDENIQWRKDSLFSKWYWESWTAAAYKLKINS